jgi:hypothetical protein
MFYYPIIFPVQALIMESSWLANGILKPAVYDKNGWHEMPYLDMGEFYSEYATYNVSLTVPSDYIVGATGTMQTKEELDAYEKNRIGK